MKVMLSLYGRFKVTLEISAMSCYFYIMIKRKISEGLSQKYKTRICHLDMHFQNIMIPSDAELAAEKLPSMSEDEQFALPASDGMMVKPPLLITDSAVIPDFKEDLWEAALK